MVVWSSSLLLVALSALSASALSPDMDPLIRNLDRNVAPGQDFFRYANGGWLAANPIPSTEHSWGVGYLVDEEVRAQLRAICESSAAKHAPKGSLEQLVGDYWATGMDSAAIERQGLAGIQGELDAIDRIRTVDDVLAAIARGQRIGTSPLHGLYVGQDDKNSSAYALFLYQGGLGLPDRDYYVLDDSTTANIRAEYPRHIAAMFRSLGLPESRAADAAGRVVDLETRLARASRTLEELRDPYANYNKLSVAAFGEATPSIDWAKQLDRMEFPGRKQGGMSDDGSRAASLVDSVVVGQPEFFATADSCLRALPIDTWKDYLRWCLVHTFAAKLPHAFDTEHFRFYGQFLAGRETQRPRWKRVLDAEESSIGDLMGQIWVQKHCSPATKARYERLVEDLFAAYAERIRHLDWMTEGTKEKALAKLGRVRKKVAYPDKWRDFTGLELDRSSYVANEARANAWWFDYQAKKIGKPVDRTEWGMTPQTYNAYYDGSNVEIVLPAAVFLVPGVPDSLLDDAMLYAYAGAATIGHEITHGFDDQGRLYDADGNLRPWWTEADSTRFTERAQRLVQQFDAYVVGERHVRGEATLGENISDLGGVVIGHDAFRRTEQWKRGEPLNGLTPDQRYFLAYAFAWMYDSRPEIMDQRILSDVHSPAFLRVNGPLANVPEFHAAFGIQPGEPMFRPEAVRVRIW